MIPVAVLGTDVVAPPGKKFGTFTRPGVRFGKPLDFSRYDGMENDRYILRSITDEIMYEIMRLSGQEYVDKYAGRAKDESKRLEREAKEAEDAETPLPPRPASTSRRPDAALVPPGARGRGPAVPGAGDPAGRRARQRGRAQRLPRRQLRPPGGRGRRRGARWPGGRGSSRGRTRHRRAVRRWCSWPTWPSRWR